jgi:hypothetical protein
VKLNIVPARTGIQWVKLGVQTFLKQPLALTGLFFMYMAAVLVISQLPIVGTVLGAMLVPAATLGLMAATAEAASGRFPMPTLLIAAFRAGRQRAKAMLILGFIYLLVIVALSLLLPIEAAPATETAPAQVKLSVGLLLLAVVQPPILVVFSLAPGLVHWHGVGPVKSIFFSVVALWRNLGAFTLFAFGWMLVVGALMLVLGLFLAAFGVEPSVQSLSPVLMIVATMISTSLYFTFRDSFHADDNDQAPPAPAPAGESTP